MDQTPVRSGFVSLVGLPNAGKSTLLNQLAGMHLAITSPKPQTTRQIVRAIIDDTDSQIIFLDTPGYNQPKNKLDRYLSGRVLSALSDSDLVVMITDAAAADRARRPALPRRELELLETLKRMQKPVLLVLNKIDQLAKENLLPLMARYHDAYPFLALIPLSAKSGDGLPVLLGEIKHALPLGPRYFPLDSLTDQTERMLAEELIREQILLLTHEEIPHGVAVSIESFEERGEPERDMVLIDATIYCERETHKGILIGQSGAMLKKIGTQSRLQIEELLGCPCYLDLFVKVREGWRNRQDLLRQLGFEARSI